MKALSIRQPWAWLIVSGHKDVENRTWATNFRGRIYVHASKRLDRMSLIMITSGGMNINKEVRDAVSAKTSWALGAIIGEIEIVDCVTQSDSPWFTGPYGFVTRSPELYKRPIPCRGKLGFFEADIPKTNP
jgi:hypothetical protein